MKNRIMTFVLGAAALTSTAMAQTSSLPLPPPVEKELAARASSVNEVTLGKNMLSFASKFMDGKDKDEAEVQKLIEGLEGIYVRNYEFDKEGQFSMEQVEQLRKYFETSEWTPLVHSRDRKNGEISDVMVKLVNGKTGGMLILSVEPKEISIVLIAGPIRMEDLGKLKGIGGLDALGDVEKSTKDKDKEKTKDKKGGGE